MAIMIVILGLFCMYANGVKSWILGPIIMGGLARVTVGKTKLTPRLIIIITFTCVVVFALSYILLMVITGQSEFDVDFGEFLLDHFMYYLIGGPLSFSIDYKMGLLEPEMTNALFAPIVNVYRLFFGGNFLNPLNPIGIHLIHSENNVRTCIGTIFAYSHSWWGLISVSLIFSLYFYIIYIYAKKLPNNPFILLANCTNLAYLVLGFFDFYWLTLNVYEMVMIYLILGFIFNTSSKNAGRKETNY